MSQAIDDRNWFTEVCAEGGSAFSFQLGPGGKLHEETTPWQTIAIYDTAYFGTLMVIDGFVMLSARDNFLYHEMMSHPVLYTHPAPKSVLIIGGGDCGTLREVLRHPGIESAVQVEIDERVTRLSEKFFPELCAANADPRAAFHFTDGIKWVEESAPGSYDVIIVDSTDPIGPAAGLFQEPFYRACHRALGDDGLLVQQSESPLYHAQLMRDMAAAMRSGGFTTTHSLSFPQPVYPSGWWSATLAGKQDTLTTFREADVAARPFPTRYYNAAIHRGALAMPEFMKG